MGLRAEIQIEKVQELLDSEETFSIHTDDHREISFSFDVETYTLKAAEKDSQTGSQIGGTIIEVALEDTIQTIAEGLINLNNGDEDSLEE